MLIRYIVSNFKSIGEMLEYTMLPSSDELDDKFVIEVQTKMGKWKILKRAGFFGPNASGKSSLIQSLAFAKHYITKGVRSGQILGLNQFKGMRGASTFQFVVSVSNDVYEYGFVIDRHRVYKEWLTKLTEDGFKEMFVRKTAEDNCSDIIVDSDAVYVSDQDFELAKFLTGTIKDNQKNQLFLYKLFDNGVQSVIPVMQWFERMDFIFPETEIVGLPIILSDNEGLRAFMASQLEKLDTGIRGIIVSREKRDLYEYAHDNKIPRKIVEDIEQIKTGIVNINGKNFLFNADDSNRTMLYELKLTHMLKEKEANFSIEDESDGTKRLMNLLPMLSMREEERVFFVDEIDRSLHTKLTQYLLDVFCVKDVKSQIIFTAHDVNLINLEHFEKDEIWFLEKMESGETKIKPLSDYSVNDNALKAYLNGRFGGIPVIRGT